MTETEPVVIQKPIERVKPNCYDCSHRGNLAFSAHSCCRAGTANVAGDPHGIKNGWFYWPLNFDPIWLKSCDSFEQK